MKIFILSLSLLSISYASSDIEFDKHWKLVRDNQVSIVWKARNKKGVYASISIIKGNGNDDVKILQRKFFFKELLNKKRKMLFFAGATQWKIKNHQWQKNIKNNASSLIMQGTYKDHQETTITFYEVHKYSHRNITQVLFTQEGKEKINKNLKNIFLEKYDINL